ncbi:MAG: hypothetical protein V3U86_02215, partial [Acidobacteriota bacterium]
MIRSKKHHTSGWALKSLLGVGAAAILLGMPAQLAPAQSYMRSQRMMERQGDGDDLRKRLFAPARAYPRPASLNISPRFKSVGREMMRKPRVIHTQVGSFDMLDLSSHIPAELLGRRPGPGTGQGASASQLEHGKVYFVLPKMQGAAGRAQVMKSNRFKILAVIPNNTYAVMLDPAHPGPMQALADFRAVVRNSAAFRMTRKMGVMAVTNRLAADSNFYFMDAVLWRGFSPVSVRDEIERKGGVIYSMWEAPYDGYRLRFATNSRGLIKALQNAEPVRSVGDTSAPFGYSVMASVISSTIQMGHYNQGQRPLHDAGIDGGGDPSRNILPQFVAVTDDGLSLDSFAFAHAPFDPETGKLIPGGLVTPDTNFLNDDDDGFCINNDTMPCTTNSDCRPDPTVVDFCKGVKPDVGPDHRKVETYIAIQDLPACVDGPCVTPIADTNPSGANPPPPTGGDFRTCDSVVSGNRTHGTIVAGLLAGNPTTG